MFSSVQIKTFLILISPHFKFGTGPLKPAPPQLNENDILFFLVYNFDRFWVFFKCSCFNEGGDGWQTKRKMTLIPHCSKYEHHRCLRLIFLPPPPILNYVFGAHRCCAHIFARFSPDVFASRNVRVIQETRRLNVQASSFSIHRPAGGLLPSRDTFFSLSFFQTLSHASPLQLRSFFGGWGGSFNDREINE